MKTTFTEMHLTDGSYLYQIIVKDGDDDTIFTCDSYKDAELLENVINRTCSHIKHRE